MNLLENIPVIRQRHPGLGPQQPFELAWEYHTGTEKCWHGDMHYALQFCIVLHGAVEVRFGDFQREYREGEVWWTMFWEPHAFRFIGQRNFVLAVNLELDHLGNCDPFGSGNWLLPFVTQPSLRHCPDTASEQGRLQSTGRMLLHQWTKRPDNWKLRGWLTIHELLLTAIDHLSGLESAIPQTASAERFRKIKPAVNLVRNSTGKPPELTEAAASCRLSVSRFSELFRQTFCLSFGKFAARARLASAARDLKGSGMDIEEVAVKWGFYDSSHFHHAFQKLYGCTPKQYQISK